MSHRKLTSAASQSAQEDQATQQLTDYYVCGRASPRPSQVQMHTHTQTHIDHNHGPSRLSCSAKSACVHRGRISGRATSNQTSCRTQAAQRTHVRQPRDTCKDLQTHVRHSGPDLQAQDSKAHCKVRRTTPRAIRVKRIKNVSFFWKKWLSAFRCHGHSTRV